MGTVIAHNNTSGYVYNNEYILFLLKMFVKAVGVWYIENKVTICAGLKLSVRADGSAWKNVEDDFGPAAKQKGGFYI